MKPHVTLNCAMSLDGFIGKPGKRIRFSNQKDKKRVHNMRARHDAIMVGINTVLTDNPHLTVRHAKGRNLVRVIVDSRGRTPLASRVLDGKAKTVIAVSKKAAKVKIKRLSDKADVIVAGKSKVDLKKLMSSLYTRKIKTLLLEGGGTLNRSMLNEKLVDEVYLTIAPVLLGDVIRWVNGALEKKMDLIYVSCMELENQLVIHYNVK